jgi:hypothetical protein
MQADLLRDFNAISSQILATLLSFWLWLCKRVAALAKTYGLKFTKPLLHYVAFFAPGPWMLLWSWQLPEYNVAKKMLHKLPQMLGGDALPSFISNPMELALAYMTLVVGVFAVVELGGLVLSQVRAALCPAKTAPVAVATVDAAEGEAVEEVPQRRQYSLSGLLKLAFLQGYCQLVLFCTDSPTSTFSAKYSLLAPLGITVSVRREEEAGRPIPPVTRASAAALRQRASSLHPKHTHTPVFCSPPFPVFAKHCQCYHSPGPAAQLPGLLWLLCQDPSARREHVPALCGSGPLPHARGQPRSLHGQLQVSGHQGAAS